MTYSIFKSDLQKTKPDILALWKRNFLGIPEERFSWIYKKNPCGPAVCWLAKEVNADKVVGATALFPKKFLIYGKPFMAGIAGDFAVDKDHRGFGPALFLQKTAISRYNETCFDFLYGFPNRQSELLLQKAGYKIAGYAITMTMLFKSEYYLKRWINLPTVAKITSWPINLALKLLSEKNSYKKNDNEFSFEKLLVFDKRFDVFWEKVSGRYPIMGERKSDYLNWRFARCPYKHYSIFGLILKRTEEILGYLVADTSQTRTHIVDLLVDDIEDIFDIFLYEFIRLQREEGISSVSITYFGHEAMIKKLKNFGFSIRDSETTALVWVAPGSPLSSCLLEKNNWYLLAGDNDV